MKEKDKTILVKKLVKKGLLWSYSPSKIKENIPDSIIIEHTLKYLDFEDIKLLFKVYPRKEILKICEKTVFTEKRFKRLSYFLVKVFFNGLPEEYIKKGVKRIDRLKLLASENTESNR